VNYYEHHIGDYDKNTSHLTACEDGIYSRMLRRYYDTEKPLPADLDRLSRLVRAHTREEKKAVAAVAAEFFFQVGDELHQKKCDEVIANFRATEPEREAKKKNEDTRLARHRAERAELFFVINGAGLHMPWNTPMAELRAAAERIRSGTSAPAATPPATPNPRSPATPPATGTATPATATHTPIPTPHTPLPNGLNTEGTYGTSSSPAGDDPVDLVGDAVPPAPPQCPHLEILALWREVLPAMPQHDPKKWHKTRREHLQTRWRETAAEKGWRSKDQGLAYFRKLFAYVGQSRFLTGRVQSRDPNKPSFVIELEWLILPSNWAKVHEGKYHAED
jgi:uncharacterized protein YdaU (DUF1376 family)